MIAIELKNTQKAVITLSPNGALAGAVAWSTPDATQVAVANVSADGLSAELVPNMADGFVGQVVVSCADADGDPAEQFEVTVSRPDANSLNPTVSVVPQ